jgi:hypothetical protein
MRLGLAILGVAIASCGDNLGGQCEVAADCPGIESECLTRRCTAGHCDPVVAPAATTCGAGVMCDGAGTCVACLDVTDCPGTDDDCQMRTCSSGVCGFVFAPVGTERVMQVPGSCHEIVCTGTGDSTTIVDDTNLPVDGNPCTADVCASGVPTNPPLAIGTSCGSGLVCDGVGRCVGCLSASYCPGSDTECESRTCTNGACGLAFAPAGTVLAAQTAGTCHVAECDGTGGVAQAIDNSNVPVDYNLCTADVCTAGSPSNPPMASGTLCGRGLVCDGTGICKSDPTAPQPIAPLSTAIVTSRRPTLRWRLPTGFDGARVEICTSRACAGNAVIETIDVTGTSAMPTADLPTGTVYWRLHGRTGSVVSASVSATWQLNVGVRSTPVDTSWGTVLDINGDGYSDVVVGAPGNGGRVYVFMGSAGGISTTPTQTIEGPDGGAFGGVVASAGDVNGDGFADVVVAAPGTTGSTGSIYLYLGGVRGLIAQPVSVRSGPDGPGAAFGNAIVSAGDINGDGYADVAIGAPGPYTTLAGTVYVYLGSPSGLSSSYSTSFVGPDGGGGDFGVALTSGDFDGDGYDDLAIGADFPLTNALGAGRTYIYRGSANGLQSSPLTLSVAERGFGNSLAAGDFNGDGYADLIVGQPRDNYLNVYSGSSMGVPSTPSLRIAPLPAFTNGTVATAGDVDGDGYADLIVGAPDTVGQLNYVDGAALVYLGGSTLATNVLLLPPGNAFFAAFGSAVAGAGDVDGDGLADVVVGAPEQDSSVGAIYIFHGKVGSISTAWSPQIGSPAPLATDVFGIAVF